MIPFGAGLIALQGFAEVLRCLRLPARGQLADAAARRGGAREADSGGGGEKTGCGGDGLISDPVLALVMLGILVFTIMIGFPVAFTLMALGVGFGYYAYYQAGTDFFDNRVFYLLTQNTFTVHQQRRAGVDPAVPVDGLHGRARQHPRSTCSSACRSPLQARAGVARRGDARHLRAVRHRDRHRRRGGHADGPARLSADAQGGLRRPARLGRASAPAAAWAS